MILFEKRNKDNVLIYTNITSRLYRKILELASHHRSIKSKEVKQETNNHQIFFNWKAKRNGNSPALNRCWLLIISHYFPLLKLKSTASKFNTSFPFWSLSKFQNTVVRCSWQTFFQSLIRLHGTTTLPGERKATICSSLDNFFFFFWCIQTWTPFECRVWSINFRASSFTIILVHFYASADILNTSAKEFEINIKEQGGLTYFK